MHLASCNHRRQTQHAPHAILTLLFACLISRGTADNVNPVTHELDIDPGIDPFASTVDQYRAAEDRVMEYYKYSPHNLCATAQVYGFMNKTGVFRETPSMLPSIGSFASARLPIYYGALVRTPLSTLALFSTLTSTLPV